MKNTNNKRTVYLLTVVMMLAAVGVLLFYAPVPINPGERAPFATEAEWINYVHSFYIAYFHIPIALTAYVAFFLVLVFSVLYLRDKQQKWDIRAAASAEVGVIFATLTLISGSIWANAAWGHYWPPGDVRLNTSLVLFLIYLAYLMIRQSMDIPEKRARLSAVFGIIGFISVPISFLSIRLWSSAYHPVVIGPGGGGITGKAVILPLVLNLLAFLLMCGSLITYRVDNQVLQEDLMETKQRKGV